MARQIRDISADNYYGEYWTAKNPPNHNAWWNDQAQLTNIEQLPNDQYRLTLSDGQVKVVEPSTILWLEMY